MSFAEDLDPFEQVAAAGILLAGERDIHVLLERCLTVARRLTHAEAGTIFLRDGERLRFTIVQNDPLAAHRGEPGMQALFAGRHLPIDDTSLAGYVAVTGETANVADAYAVLSAEAAHFDGTTDTLTGYRTCAILAVPLLGAHGEAIGVLELINAVDENGAIVPFEPRLELPVRWLAAQAAVAVLRVRELEDLTFIDATTGLPNRRYLQRRAEEAVVRHGRFGHPVSVVFLAIDRLREIAVQDGQAAADDIVRGLGRRLAGISRNFTVLGRYGPETFGAVLANTGQAGALAYAKRVKGVADGAPGGADALTTSVGLASMPEDAATLDDLIEIGLDRLIAARRSGGNAIRAE